MSTRKLYLHVHNIGKLLCHLLSTVHIYTIMRIEHHKVYNNNVQTRTWRNLRHTHTHTHTHTNCHKEVTITLKHILTATISDVLEGVRHTSNVKRRARGRERANRETCSMRRKHWQVHLLVEPDRGPARKNSKGHKMNLFTRLKGLMVKT